MEPTSKFFVVIFTVPWILSYVHGFQPMTFNSSEPIGTVTISNSDDVFIVKGHTILMFRNLSLDMDELAVTFESPSSENLPESVSYDENKISFFAILTSGDKQLILQCDSKYCYIHSVSDTTRYTKVTGNVSYFSKIETIGAERSASSVLIPEPSQAAVIFRIFSAQVNHDGDAFMSERTLFVTNTMAKFVSSQGDKCFFKSTGRQHFEFVSSFNTSNHVYFLRNARQETGIYQGHISQTCSLDIYFRSYVESKLECGGYPYILAATIAKTNRGNVLVASFSLQPFLDEFAENSESVICTYDISDLESYFYRTTTNCFKHMKGQWPEWIEGNGQACETRHESEDYHCGYTDLNTRIASDDTLHLNIITPKYHYENVVAIVTRTLDAQTLMYFGTHEGEIMKAMYNSSANTLKRTLKLKVSSLPVRQVTLSKDGSTLFYVSGKTVGKIPLNKCIIFPDCYSCLMANLSCVWASNDGKTGQCASRADARNVHLFHNEDFCRPVVYAIEPTTGPTGGGTVLTISGQFDIPDWYGMIYSNDHISSVPVTIRLGQYPCNLTDVTQFPKQIKCVTPRHQNSANETLQFEMVRKRRTSYGSDWLIRSEIGAMNTPTFSFLEPKLDGSAEIAKQKVRLSGGTQITIYGSNLHIGNKHTKRITVGNKDCAITSHDRILPDMVTCRSPDQNETGSYDIRYTIDNNTVGGQLSVTYIPNPIVDDIQPRSSIVSGGTHVTITGKNLEGLGRNNVMVNIDIDEKGGHKRVTSNCVFVDDTHAYSCKTTPSPIKDHLPMLGFANIYNIYGKLVSLDLATYVVPDPVLQKEDKFVDEMTDSGGYLLYYKGDGLQNISIDDVRVLVGVTDCSVSDVSNSSITCVFQNLSGIGTGVRDKVVCHIGFQTYYLGTVAFQGPNLGLSRTNPEESGPFKLESILKVLGATVLGGMLLAVIAVAIRKRHQAAKARKRDRFSVRFHNDHRVLNLQGLSDNMAQDAQQNRSNDYVENRLQRVDMEEANDKEDAHLLDDETRNMLEMKNLLISSDLLIIGETVGQGNFGCVYKGYLRMPEEKCEKVVACKTLQRNKPREMDVNSFLKEALIMKDFHHRNVMELVGICLGIEKLPLVVLPFMRIGDVLTYIRNIENVPTVKDLVVFGVDIASGMHYLSQLKFVHRDLAARNCMIDEDMTVKVADFGLSRDVYEKEYYSSSDKKAQLPVKWMSPESLEFGLFTTKSDVWSFGVVLWELLTRGVNPYPTVDNWDILRYLSEGRRLTKPEFCPGEMYRIMQSCWEWNPDDRPTFDDLIVSIPQLLRRLERASERRRHLESLTEEREKDEQVILEVD